MVALGDNHDAVMGIVYDTISGSSSYSTDSRATSAAVLVL